MLRQLRISTAVLLTLACAWASADEKPAFDLQVPSSLESGKTEHRVMLMNNTGQELSLKLSVTPLQSVDPAMQGTYEVVLRSTDKDRTMLNLAHPVKLAPGEVRQLIAQLPSQMDAGKYLGYFAAYETEHADQSRVIHKPFEMEVKVAASAANPPLSLKKLVGGALTFNESCFWPFPFRCRLDRTIAVRFPPDATSRKVKFDPVLLMGPNGRSILLKPTGSSIHGSTPSEQEHPQDETTISLGFEQVGPAGTYTGSVGPGEEKDQVTIVLNVARHWFWALLCLAAGGGAFYLLQNWTSKKKRLEFDIRCNTVLSRYAKQHASFQKTLDAHKVPVSARAFDIGGSVTDEIVALKREASHAARSVVMFDPGAFQQRCEDLERRVDGWSDFGLSLAILGERLANAGQQSPKVFVPGYSRTTPRLFEEALALFVEKPESKLSVSSYEARKALVDGKAQQVQSWTELNHDLLKLYRECEALMPEQPATDGEKQTAAKLDAAKKSMERVWYELWERTDQTVPLDANGNTLVMLLNSAQNTLHDVVLSKASAPALQDGEGTDNRLGGAGTDNAARRTLQITKSPGDESQMLALKEQARLDAKESRKADWILGATTAAVVLVTYFHDIYNVTWGDDFTDYLVAFSTAYGSQLFAAVLATVLQRQSSSTLLNMVKLPTK